MFLIDVQFSLPYVYDFDRAIVRLAGDPVNSVDLQSRTVRIPMEEGNSVTLQSTGTKQLPSFIVENAIDDIQIETVKSIFHFDKPLGCNRSHILLEQILDRYFLNMKGLRLLKVFHCMELL